MNCEQIVDYICQEMKEELYHTIYLNGKKYQGRRNGINRIKKIHISLSSRILDLGCNMGGMIWPYRCYMKEAIGIDKRHIEFCKSLARIYGIENKTKFIEYNLEDSLENLNLGEFDLVFYLAVIMHMKNWKAIIDWAYEHSSVFVMEFNGNKKNIDAQVNYVKSIYDGMDYLGEFDGRYMYICYKNILFEINGRKYNTYKHSSGTNAEVYYCPANDVVIKKYKNISYEIELNWCEILPSAPNIIAVDDNRKIIIQEFVGDSITYYNAPEDYELQIEKIKKELSGAHCTGEDIEFCVKDNKIRIVDLSACDYGEKLGKRSDNVINCLHTSRKQYFSGEVISW